MHSCRPRLFVYTLPPRYRDDREGGFGSIAPATLSLVPSLGIRLWHTAEFALGDLLHQRALQYRCRTQEPELADLFFVPAYSSKQRNRPTEKQAEGGNLRALHARLRQVRVSERCHRADETGARGNCSALEARGGADHLLINPRNGAPYERHPLVELDYLDPRFGNATLLDLMEPGDWPWFGNYQPEPRYHSIPHPSLVHQSPDSSGASNAPHRYMLPWRSSHARSTLVAGAFGVAHGPRAVVALRLALQRACDAAPPSTCRFHRLGDKAGARSSHNRTSKSGASTGTQFWSDQASAGALGTSPGERSRSTLAPVPVPVPVPVTAPSAPAPLAEPGWYSIARLYFDATFCMQPPGDAVSRKAIVDSLLLGCIPVLFHVGQTKQWPWHWGAWQANASVFLDMERINRRQLNPIAALQAIPKGRIREMQRTIATHAHRMQYAAVDLSALPPPQPPDAFEVTLSHAWRRSRDRTVVDSGRATQRSNGARLDAAIQAFEREPSLGSWGGRSSGTCSRTWGVPGDCTRGDSGTWRLGADGGMDLFSMEDCAEACQRCGRCRWISLSIAHQQCDWYHTCNTSKLNRKFGGETFRTRRVKSQA